MQRAYEKHGFFSFSERGRNRELYCLKHGESGINTVCRVLQVSRRELRTSEGAKKLGLHGIIADDTAKLPFVSWEEERVEFVRDAVIQIENAYVERWEGLPTLYTGKNTNVRVFEEIIGFPPYAALIKPRKRRIDDIVRCEGAFDVLVEGDIVSVSEDQNERTLVLDDGTGAVSLVLREKEKEAHIQFGMPIKARGNVVVSEKGSVVLMAEEIKILGEAFIIHGMKDFLCRYT